VHYREKTFTGRSGVAFSAWGSVTNEDLKQQTRISPSLVQDEGTAGWVLGDGFQMVTFMITWTERRGLVGVLLFL
jgi:hypothetical protein